MPWLLGLSYNWGFLSIVSAVNSISAVNSVNSISAVNSVNAISAMREVLATVPTAQRFRWKILKVLNVSLNTYTTLCSIYAKIVGIDVASYKTYTSRASAGAGASP